MLPLFFRCTRCRAKRELPAPALQRACGTSDDVLSSCNGGISMTPHPEDSKLGSSCVCSLAALLLVLAIIVMASRPPGFWTTAQFCALIPYVCLSFGLGLVWDKPWVSASFPRWAKRLPLLLLLVLVFPLGFAFVIVCLPLAANPFVQPPTVPLEQITLRLTVTIAALYPLFFLGRAAGRWVRGTADSTDPADSSDGA